MKQLTKIAILMSLLMTASFASAESKYDVKELYKVTKPTNETVAVGKNGNTVEVEYILTPTKVDTGKYAVEVKKIGDNLYQIIDTNLCVETRYCYEWASFSEKVILVIESNYGYTKGEIFFD